MIDPELQFFNAVAWYLHYTWRLHHDLGTMTRADLIGRKTERVEQIQSYLADLRSFRRMSKDPNSYRAIFRGPKPRLNQLQMKITAPIEIQVHQATKDRWEAWYYYSVDHRATAPLLTDLGAAVTSHSLDGIKERTRDQFETQVRGWQTYDQFGKLAPPEPITRTKA